MSDEKKTDKHVRIANRVSKLIPYIDEEDCPEGKARGYYAVVEYECYNETKGEYCDEHETIKRLIEVEKPEASFEP